MAKATADVIECNCLAIRQAARRITQMYDAELAPSGLRTTQYSLLRLLDRRGGATIRELAEALVMDRSTLGHNLRPLERQGLVELGAGAKDKRARALCLTEAGRSRLKAAKRYWVKAQTAFHQRYGEDDARHLRSLLERVLQS